MASSARTVLALARRAAVPVDLALDLLRDAGIAVLRAQDHIAPQQLHLAEATLDLIVLRPRRPKAAPQNQLMGQPARITETSAPAPLPHPSKPRHRARDIPVVGRRQQLEYLSYGTVERIHWGLVDEFGRSRDPIDPPGIKSADLLHSALSRCSTSLGGDLKYPTVAMAGAATLHSMINNHPFHNGNKRTALVALLVMLDLNGWRLHAEDDELFKFLLSVASHGLVSGFSAENKPEADKEVLVIADWLNQRIRRIEYMRPSLKWHDLRGVLSRHGCTFNIPKRGNRLNIERDGLHCQVWFGGDNRDVRLGEIPKIREELHLDSEHGCDDDVFFDATEKLPAFVTKYRKILERLAKV